LEESEAEKGRPVLRFLKPALTLKFTPSETTGPRSLGVGFGLKSKADVVSETALTLSVRMM